MRKLFILACVVLCTASVASAQGKVSEFFKSYDWTPKYRGEVNIGFVAAGSKTSINSISSYKDSDGSNVSEQMALPSKYHSSFSRPLIETIHGAQFDKYLFVGAGVGFQYYYGKLRDFEDYATQADIINGRDQASTHWNASMLPLFVNIKFMFPIKEEIVPFINLNLGGTIALGSSLNYRINESDFDGINDLIGAWGEDVKYSNNQRIGGGFYCDFGIGLRWKCVQLGIGLQHQDLKVVSKTDISVGKEYTKTVDKDKFSNNAFYVKLGFAF